MNLETAATAAPTAGKGCAMPQALARFDDLPDAANVRLPVVAALFDVGPATVWRWAKSKRLPAPLKLSPGVTVWNVGQLRQHLAQCRVG